MTLTLTPSHFALALGSMCEQGKKHGREDVICMFCIVLPVECVASYSADFFTQFEEQTLNEPRALQKQTTNTNKQAGNSNLGGGGGGPTLSTRCATRGRGVCQPEFPKDFGRLYLHNEICPAFKFSQNVGHTYDYLYVKSESPAPYILGVMAI